MAQGMGEITNDKVNCGWPGATSYLPPVWTESLHRAEKVLTEDKAKTRMRLGSGSGLPED